MKRVGFTMKLNPGMKDEYRKRHDKIWPELLRTPAQLRHQQLLHLSGREHQHTLRQSDGIQR